MTYNNQKSHLNHSLIPNSKLFITDTLYLLLRNEPGFEKSASKIISDSKELLEKMTNHSSINESLWYYLIAKKLQNHSNETLLHKVNFELIAKHLISSQWK
jgi:hypothetical protein